MSDDEETSSRSATETDASTSQPPPPDPIHSDVFTPQRGPNNYERREIAETTLSTIDHGSFELNGRTHDLRTIVDLLIQDTTYYFPESELREWSDPPTSLGGPTSAPIESDVSIVQCSTLEGCHQMHELLAGLQGDIDRRIGVLNFASAKKPGGGFLTGAQAQEETIARSSTLYASLMIDTAQQFYGLHHHCGKSGYYTHAMIYSPRVQIFKYDSGELHEPIEVDVLTTAAVNAGVVRSRMWDDSNEEEEESRIYSVMSERMGRLLYLFEKRGVKNLILGSFGTGVFRNQVEMVARIWVELLVAEGSRFKHSFQRIVFAIIDTPTVNKFRGVFTPDDTKPEEEDAMDIVSDADVKETPSVEPPALEAPSSEGKAEPRL